MEHAQSLVEYAHINEMHEDLRRKLTESQRRDLGRMDSLRQTILSMVVGENYERAIVEMQAYIELKSNYPVFQDRVQRYFHHCSELIQAIETKRNFPGLANLSLAKQQEIHDKVMDHFEDLKSYLKQIEKVEREQKLVDVRSTVWVLRAFSVGLISIFFVGLILDARTGAFSSVMPLTDHYVDVLSTWVVKLVKL